jgi:hypothetical protein
MTIHYRKDHKNGITAPNPEGQRDVIAHITKHRGMKTPYTSVSEDKNAIKHFSGVLYKTDIMKIKADAHCFITHAMLLNELQKNIQTTRRAEKILAERAYLLAQRAKEALIDWQFNLTAIRRTERIKFCYTHIQKYFTRD